MISLSFGFGAIVAVSACGPQSDAALQDAKRSDIPTFESELWPGEGVPVIEAVSRRIILCVSPRGGAEVADTLLEYQSRRLPFDSTRFQTLAAARIRVARPSQIRGRILGRLQYLSTQRYYAPPHVYTTMNVDSTDVLEYLQYRAEGTCFVRLNGLVIDADPCPARAAPEFAWSGEPVTAWWIHVNVAVERGWLLLADSTAVIADRTF